MIGVVFVNFHSEALIQPKAAHLMRCGFQVAVVDNSGTYPTGTERVAAPSNLGFGPGCNLAVAALTSGVEVLCFHNPDVDIPATAIEELGARLAGQAKPGIVAPAEKVGPRLRTAGYHYPSLLRETLLAAIADRREPNGTSRAVRRRTGSMVGRRFAGGALLLVARAAHDAIGGFDEDYFMYGEDLDYWDRMRVSGRGVSFAPEVVAEHASGTGSPLGSSSREVLRWLGVELFVASRSGAWRLYRASHRAALRRMTATPLTDAVRELWEAQLAPRAVLQELRPGLRSGALVPSRS